MAWGAGPRAKGQHTSAGREKSEAGPRFADPSERCTPPASGHRLGGWAAGRGRHLTPQSTPAGWVGQQCAPKGRIECSTCWLLQGGWAACCPGLVPASPLPALAGRHPGAGSQDWRGSGQGQPATLEQPADAPKPGYPTAQPGYPTSCCQPNFLLPASRIMAPATQPALPATTLQPNQSIQPAGASPMIRPARWFESVDYCRPACLPVVSRLVLPSCQPAPPANRCLPIFHSLLRVPAA